jgi:predicted NodU family carbamoyl transferase
VIKRRAPFQPFAPVVPAASAARFFHDAPNDMTPFMTCVCDVRNEVRESLAAVTHVDGSARAQTLEAGPAERLLRGLGALERAGHSPVALNTSLNGSGEPIVAHATDAVAFLASHEVDALLIEDVLLRRPG